MKIINTLCIIAFMMLALCCNLEAKVGIRTAPTPSWVRTSKLAPKQIDHLDVSLGYYYERVEYQVNLRQQTKFYKDVKVLFDSNGAENAGQVFVNFDPSYQELIVHELQVVRDGIVLNKLDPNKFEIVASETDLSRFIYNGSYSAYLILEDLRKDDKIIFSYSLKGFNPVFEQKFSDKFYLQSYEPTGLVHINYVVPKNRPLQFKMHQGAQAGKVEEGAEDRSYVWELTTLPTVQHNSYAPIWYTGLQWGECSEYNSWTELAEWAARVNPVSTLVKGSPLAVFVDKCWAEAKGNEDKFIEVLTDFVQNNVRYMGVETGEYSHRANSPEKVFNQRYGDCKDKSVLLASMLKYKGIDCSLVLVNSYSDKTVADRLPTPLAFNHMTVVVNQQKEQLFIDATMANQGGPIISRYYPDYGKLLVLNNSNTLVNAQMIGQGSISITENYLLDNHGGAMLTVESLYYGAEADIIRNYFKTNARNLIQKNYLEYYQRVNPSATLMEPLTFVDKLSENKIRVVEKYRLSEVGEFDKASQKDIIGVYANHIKERLVELSSPDGDAPLAIGYPLALDYIVRIVNYDGIAFKPEEHNESISRDAYYYNKNVKTKNDSLIIHYSLNYYSPIVSAEDKIQYFNDFKNLNTKLYNAYYLNDKGAVEGADVPGDISWLAIITTLLIILIVGFFLSKYNKSSPIGLITVHKEARFDSIGSWLILFGISIFIAVCVLLFNIFKLGFFQKSVWSAYLYAEGFSEMGYKFMVAAEFIICLLSILGLLFSIYLFFSKRDIFPQTIFIVLAFNLLGNTCISTILSHYQSSDFFVEVIVNNLRQTIYVVLWGSYLFKSERVKDTFVRTYQQDVDLQLDDETITPDAES